MLRRAGYVNVVSTTDPWQVAMLYAEHDPDLIVLDLHMPQMEGYEVMQDLTKRIPPGTYRGSLADSYSCLDASSVLSLAWDGISSRIGSTSILRPIPMRSGGSPRL
jgi:CheY-like chemotaxis protein